MKEGRLKNSNAILQGEFRQRIDLHIVEVIYNNIHVRDTITGE